MPDLGVIHLRRKNLLRQLVSFEVAKATNVYRSNSPKTPRVSHDEVALEIGRKHCETFMRRTTDAARAACARLSNCEHLDLTYEEMTESPEATEATMRRTLDFLGLRHIALQSQLRKQVNRPVRDLVRNYDELASAFAKTEWADCFDE
ncbi:MAG: sulfotransferase [Planctomycetota bacterium]